MSDTDIIRFEVSDYIALVTLNRPPVNALDRAMRDRLIEIFDQISEREDIRVAVLTSSQRVFCAGADLRARPDLSNKGAFHDHNRVTRETGNCIHECAKPVIAAINGAALGAGLGLMAACDIFFASEEAVFGMPEINVGLAGGAAMINSLFGKSTTRRIMYTGMRLTARDLYRLNIIEEVTTQEALLPTAMKVAAEIASKAPLGIRYAKRSCNMVELMPQRDAYRFEQNFTMELAASEDALEARRATLEKRQPVFKGR
jgi:enoyl-CoA hydratase